MRITNILVVFCAMSTAPATWAQAPSRPPSGVAADVTNAQIQAALKKTASAAVSDQQLRVESINGEYNVAVGVLHRSRASATAASGVLEHSQITEVYSILEGSGTFVTGGTMDNVKDIPPDNEIVKTLAGPSTSSGPIQHGVSRKVGPGDVIIIPPNTPHGFSEITTSEVVYLVVRVDPHKVLPAGYVAK
jgi:mannose-6-phosphate isomerase-like protein (cupin superfamily)